MSILSLAYEDAAPTVETAPQRKPWIARLEHFQAKWIPVRRPEMRPNIILERVFDAKPVTTFAKRALAAIHASRMRKAREEIARHRHLLPADFELAGDTLNERSEDQLPFVRCG